MAAATPAPADRRVGREWINRASLSGVVLVVGALAVIQRTDASADDIAAIFGGVLLGVGALRIAFSRLAPRTSVRILIPSLILVGGGVALVAVQITSISLLGRLVALILALSGVFKLTRAFGSWRAETDGDLPRTQDADAEGIVEAVDADAADDDPQDAAILARVRRPANVLLIEAALLLVAAAVLAVVPEVLLSLLILVASFAALGMGLILIAFGVGSGTRDRASGIDTLGLLGVVRSWGLQRDIGEARRAEVADALFYEGPQTRTRRASFAVLMVLSTLIATFGIIQNSTAVVIGAMLVAPLMTPILGVAAGIIGAWPRRAAASLATVIVGALLAVGVAVLASSWLPTTVNLESNSQITSRVSPTLLDLAIAVAAGAAGAYASIDRRVSSSLTGVAIAVALVPPLAVVGVTLHTGDLDGAGGAALLFATNAVAIVLAGSLVFLVAGFSTAARLRRYQDALRTSLLSVLVIGLAIIIPLSLTGEALIAATVTDDKVQTAITTWLPDEPGWSLLSWDLDADVLAVTVAGPTAAPPLQPLEAAVQEAIAEDVAVVLSLISSETVTSGPLSP